MKKIIALLVVIVFFGTNVFAFKPEVNILTKAEIKNLSDEKILETYVDIIIEIEAVTAFHHTAGFSAKDYKKFKKLLHYRVLLIQEIRGRDLKPLPVE